MISRRSSTWLAVGVAAVAACSTVQPSPGASAAPSEPIATASPVLASTLVHIDGIVVDCGDCAYFATIQGPTGSWERPFEATSQNGPNQWIVIDSELQQGGYDSGFPRLSPGRYTLTPKGWTLRDEVASLKDRLLEVQSTCSTMFDVVAGMATLRFLVEFTPGDCHISFVVPTSG